MPLSATTCLLGSLASALLASVALAQAPAARVAGTVRDSAGAPVHLAQLSVREVRAISDSSGKFVLDGLPTGAGTLQVRRLGFAPLDVSLQLASGQTDTVRLVLAAVARELPEETATGDGTHPRLVDFIRHRLSGQGQYFNRREIEAQKAQRLSDLLRRLPGVRILTDRSGRAQLRMSRTVGNCGPDFFIDGVRAPFLSVDDVPLQDIEALEIYRGHAAMPPEFQSRLGNSSCGAVVIWTRRPG